MGLVRGRVYDDIRGLFRVVVLHGKRKVVMTLMQVVGPVCWEQSFGNSSERPGVLELHLAYIGWLLQVFRHTSLRVAVQDNSGC